MPKGLPTGTSRGLKAGDFVDGGHFVGIIMANVRTFAPTVESWACTMSHEMGSAYATELTKITYDQFMDRAQHFGYDGPRSEAGKKAVAAARAALRVPTSEQP